MRGIFREHGAAARINRRGGCQVRPNWIPAVLIAGFSVLLGGCVYLRLLELKMQLGKFDEYFALQTSDGLAIICKTPVLRTDDIRWIGLRPESVKKLGRAEQWIVRWVKQLPPGVSEKIEYDVVLELGFVEDRLTRVAIPERYFAILPKPFLIGVIKSLASGRIDKSQKKIEATVAAGEIAAARPNLPSIDKLLGRASEERVEGANTVVRYRYVPSTKESKAGVFDMQLTFETRSGELLKWQGKTPVGNIGFNFAADRDAK